MVGIGTVWWRHTTQRLIYTSKPDRRHHPSLTYALHF